MSVLQIAVACIVALVWAVVYLAAVFNPNLHAPPELSAVMLGVVTWLFGRAFRDGINERARTAARKLLEEDDPDD